MPENTPTDRELVCRLVAGDAFAWRFIYDKYHDLMRTEAFRQLGDRDDAEDAVQESFYRFFTYRARFNPDRDSLRPYLMTILRNVCKDIYRRRVGRDCGPRDEHLPEPAAPEAEEPLLRSDEREQFWKAVESFCDPRGRGILALICKGLRNKEIAAALGMKETTISSYICDIKGKASKVVSRPV